MSACRNINLMHRGCARVYEGASAPFKRRASYPLSLSLMRIHYSDGSSAAEGNRASLDSLEGSEIDPQCRTAVAERNEAGIERRVKLKIPTNDSSCVPSLMTFPLLPVESSLFVAARPSRVQRAVEALEAAEGWQ